MSNYKDNYDLGYDEGFADGRAHAIKEGLHLAQAQQLHLALDQHFVDAERIEAKKAFAAVLLADTPAKRMAVCDAEAKPVYQGKLVMCASCGNPIGDSPVQKNEYGNIFLYCSASCRNYHAVGA